MSELKQAEPQKVDEPPRTQPSLNLVEPKESAQKVEDNTADIDKDDPLYKRLE